MNSSAAELPLLRASRRYEYLSFLNTLLSLSGAPGAEIEGGREAERKEGRAAGPDPEGPDLAAPVRAGEMKSESIEKNNTHP